MLESVRILNFKGFKNTSIGPFRMVNLIIGGQNVGKTSVLEAICAPSAGWTYGAKFRVHEGTDDHRYSMLFGGSAQVSLEGALEGIPLPIPITLPSQLEQVMLFGRVVLGRKRDLLVRMLQQVEPRLESLDDAAPDGEHRVYAGLAGVPAAVPMPQLGHGFNRLFVLYAQLLITDSKLALIDEVENGVHYSALPTLFQGIKTVARDRNVQSLITTHSWDCLRAACEVFEDEPDMFQVIRLERHDDDVKAVCIDGARMLRLMAEEREVR